MNVNNEWNRIYEKGCGVVSRLMPLCGCENEIPEPTASVVSAGKFVVDYTTAAGAATRVIHENQRKGYVSTRLLTCCIVRRGRWRSGGRSPSWIPTGRVGR